MLDPSARRAGTGGAEVFYSRGAVSAVPGGKELQYHNGKINKCTVYYTHKKIVSGKCKASTVGKAGSFLCF